MNEFTMFFDAARTRSMTTVTTCHAAAAAAAAADLSILQHTKMTTSGDESDKWWEQVTWHVHLPVSAVIFSSIRRIIIIIIIISLTAGAVSVTHVPPRLDERSSQSFVVVAHVDFTYTTINQSLDEQVQSKTVV